MYVCMYVSIYLSIYLSISHPRGKTIFDESGILSWGWCILTQDHQSLQDKGLGFRAQGVGFKGISRAHFRNATGLTRL